MYNFFRKTILIFNLLILNLLFTSFSFKKEYGVFLGLNNKEIKRLENYKIIVIEAEEFDKNHLMEFHKKNQKVFAYLNVGALENYRSYYSNYERFSLGIYNDWPDEKWIDVSKKEWQDFIIKKLAFEYKQKGFDGFFIDNTDVYYQYQKEEIYQGLITILKGLHKYNLEIIINGGDYFVSKLINEKKDIEIFDGVNQECVFTLIDFKNNKYIEQSSKENKYFTEYLEKVKKQNKKVFLLEYGANRHIKSQIIKYCKKHDFNYFISLDKSLTKEKD